MGGASCGKRTRHTPLAAMARVNYSGEKRRKELEKQKKKEEKKQRRLAHQSAGSDASAEAEIKRDANEAAEAVPPGAEEEAD